MDIDPIAQQIYNDNPDAGEPIFPETAGTYWMPGPPDMPQAYFLKWVEPDSPSTWRGPETTAQDLDDKCSNMEAMNRYSEGK